MRLPDLFKRLGLFKLISTYIDSKLGYNEGGGEGKKNCSPDYYYFHPSVYYRTIVVQDGDNSTPRKLYVNVFAEIREKLGSLRIFIAPFPPSR